MLPLDLVRLVGGHCDRMELEYFVTGSVASAYYGEYRSTKDLDVVVALPVTRAAEFCAAFPQPDWYASEQAAKEAALRSGMFNLIHAPSGLKVDVIMRKDTPFHEQCLHRARRVELPGGGSAMFSAPEDVILNKLLFYREGGSEKHPRDIASMIKVSGGEIDQTYLEHWSLRLGVAAEWRTIKSRLGLS